MDLNPDSVLGSARLTVVYNADHVIADGGDIAVSPDNIDVSKDYLMICEDGTAQSRLVMAEKGRNGNIWRLNLQTGAMENVAEVTAVGRTGVPLVRASGKLQGSSMPRRSLGRTAGCSMFRPIHRRRLRRKTRWRTDNSSSCAAIAKELTRSSIQAGPGAACLFSLSLIEPMAAATLRSHRHLPPKARLCFLSCLAGIQQPAWIATHPTRVMQ